jgi:V/A-type H+-transporting ATPase subunit E
MTEELKNLIEKIQQEGVQAAEEKAAAIVADACRERDRLLAEAQKEAQEQLRQAVAEISSREEKTRALLSQASRDMLLALRQEINLMLERLLLEEVRGAFSVELLEKILQELILKSAAAAGGEVVISVSEREFKRLQEGLFAQLRNEVKKGLVLSSSDQLRAGFTISFDSGKSQFDFSDQALAEYLGAYLKPSLKELLRAATTSS